MGMYIGMVCLSASISSHSPLPCTGPLTGHKVVGMRMVLEDGVSHAVDSNELSFRMAAIGAVRASTSWWLPLPSWHLLYACVVQCVYCFVYMTIGSHSSLVIFCLLCHFQSSPIAGFAQAMPQVLEFALCMCSPVCLLFCIYDHRFP